jgi:dTDP-4-amino-4,6-dideoxygalactose transaminase
MTRVPFFQPLIGQAEIDEVLDTLRSGWLTTGPKVARFEKDFAAFAGSKHSIAVSSATGGLHLSLEALGVKPRDRVAVPVYTFTATAEVVRYLGADPVFVDVDAKTFNIDVAELEKALRDVSGIVGIMPVHFAGQACDMDEITDMARVHNLWVVEDAAHALPTTYKGEMIGKTSATTVYSFYASKTITTGEGGMVVTNREEVAKRIRTMRLHGISRDIFDRFTTVGDPWYYEIVAPGFKYNMTDVSAALGIHQLKKAREFQSQRAAIVKRYNNAFKDLPLCCPHVARPADTHAHHLYVIQLKLEELRISRDRFIELVTAAGIGTSVHFIPLHIQPYWRERYNLNRDDFPRALDIFSRCVSLPLYQGMEAASVERVIDVVTSVLRANRR